MQKYVMHLPLVLMKALDKMTCEAHIIFLLNKTGVDFP